MVDYTTSKNTSGSAIGFIIVAGFVVAVLLYAIYAGGDAGTADRAVTDPAAPTAPVTDSTAPAVPTQ